MTLNGIMASTLRYYAECVKLKANCVKMIKGRPMPFAMNKKVRAN